MIKYSTSKGWEEDLIGEGWYKGAHIFWQNVFDNFLKFTFQQTEAFNIRNLCKAIMLLKVGLLERAGEEKQVCYI